MSSKSGKATTSESKSKTKALLLMLEKLLSASNPDKEQTRFLCQKLLHLVNNHEAARKEISSKSGLETVLSILETCGDQSTCLALVNILSEIASGSGVKRLVTHDVTRVLLHTVAYLGKEADNRLLTALLSLSVKIAPKDRRFALRVRLAGALPVLVSIVRSSTSHFSSNKLLSSALQCLKICASNGVNASVLGRLGAVHVLQKLISSLGRKFPSLIKTALSTLSLLLKSSRSNASHAVGNGMMIHMLALHQDWHKSDVRNHRHIPARKSMLNIIKHLTSSKAGRKAFADAGGLRILHRTCKECVELPCSKASEPLLNVGTLILRRCQPRFRLPIPTVQCSFKFQLPDSGGDAAKINGENTSDDVDDVIDASDDEDEDEVSDSVDAAQDMDNDLEDDKSQAEAKDPPKTVPPPIIMPPLGTASPPKRRPSDLCSMYEHFFPELLDFQLPKTGDETLQTEEAGKPDETKQSTNVLPELIINGLSPRAPTYSKEKSPRYSRCGNLGPGLRRHSCDPESPRHQPFKTLSTSNLLGPQGVYKQSSVPNPSAHQEPFLRFNSFLPLSIDKQDPCTNNCAHDNASDEHTALMRLLAPTTRSEKQDVNTVSYADLFGHVPPGYAESQVSKKYGIQRVRMLDDIGRTLKQGDLINKVVYTRDGGYQPPKTNDYWAYDVETSPARNTQPQGLWAQTEGFESPDRNEAECEELTPRIQDACCFMRGDTVTDGDPLTKLPHMSSGFGGEYLSSMENEEATLKLKTPLGFRSNFECGNLRTAIQVRENEYDLILDADCNTNHHHQWFYFEVSNVSAGVPYRFNFVNCEKSNSQFNFGMQPLMYSVAEAQLGRPCWKRVGGSLCYYKSHFSRSAASAGGVKGRSYYTMSFTVTFTHDGDVCYFSYHYPYTYTQLQADLHHFVSQVDQDDVYISVQTLCHTLGGNPVPVLTVTARPNIVPEQDNHDVITEFRTRPYVFLSARVHPGESNSSWTMRGTLKCLLMSKNAQDVNQKVLDVVDQLRHSYIFKIVPMLNPDGVINGHHRCSLTGEDLNRQWTDPDPKLFPTIYHTKGLLQYLHSIGKAPLVYCDYHGHSRRKNVFMYGCSRKESILAGESDMIYGAPDDAGYKTLPKLLHQLAPAFSMSNCSFVVEKCKESTARVVVWKELGVARSYTMESTYCGCDQGKYKGSQIGTSELEEMGAKLCEGLLQLKIKDRARRLPVFDLPYIEEESYNSPSDISSNDVLSVDSEACQQVGGWGGKYSQSDSDYCGGSAPCPTNSDEELTPDDVDSVASFDAPADSNGGAVSEDPLIGRYSREFWDYNQFYPGAGFGFAGDDENCVNQEPETEMTYLAAGENVEPRNDAFAVAQAQLKKSKYHICPDTGRVEYDDENSSDKKQVTDNGLSSLLKGASLQDQGLRAEQTPEK